MRTRFNIRMALGAFALFGLALAQTAKAGFVNGGFEGFPDFTGYTTIGNASIQPGPTPGDFYPPPEGVQQAVISNSSSAAPDTFPAVPVVALEVFFNLTPGTLSTGYGATTGSGFQQTVALNAGDVVTFDFNFVTNEPPSPPGNLDLAFLTIDNGSGAVLFKLADVNGPPNGPTNPIDGINAYFIAETGYILGTVSGFGTQNYTFGWGVVNVNDTSNSSGLLVDDIKSSPGGVVPLPSTAWAGMALLGGFGILQAARRRKVIAA